MFFARVFSPLFSTFTRFLATSILCFFLFVFAFSTCRLIQPETYVYSGCSSEKFPADAPYQSSFTAFLQSAVSSSSQVSYGSFAIGNDTTPPLEAALFGLYQCRGDLKLAECSRCVQNAANQVVLLCPLCYGASLQLDGCSLRYEHANFLGLPDTSLMFKKCSESSVSNDAEFFRRRDDVLADLQTAVVFKVSSSGFVEGYGQCMGDVAFADCSACLTQAVVSLKSLCGSSASGSVYLAKCYAKYWAAGYYVVSSDASDKVDGVGKTVAIAVGVVAAVAVFIVILSVCRKASG